MSDDLTCMFCFWGPLFFFACGWAIVAASKARDLAQRALAASTSEDPQRLLQERIVALERRSAELEREVRALRGVGAPEASFQRAVAPEPALAPEEQDTPVTSPVEERSTFARRSVAAYDPLAPASDYEASVAAEEPSALVAAEPPDAPRIEAPAVAASAPPVDEPLPAPKEPAPPRVAPEPSWEQWLGVRGAAAAGAIVLAIAAVYFFRYSMEHGLISPTTRVVIGTLVGLGCVLSFELRLRRTHRALGEYLAGAGFAILYLSFWAADARYHLVPSSATTVLLIAVTGACCAFAYARHAAPVAALGMLGGFATPMLLSTGEDKPVSLFAYVLLLDAALLLLARRRSWSWLALASLVGTVFYQAVWFATRLDGPRTWLGVAIVLVFAVFFALALPRKTDDPTWKGTRVAAILLPALYALGFGLSMDVGPSFVPIACLLVVLNVGALVVAREPGMDWLGLAASSSAMVTLALLVLRSRETTLGVWQATGTLFLLLGVHAAARELGRRRAWPAEPFSGFDVVLFGGLVIELFVVLRPGDYHPLVHFLALAGLVLAATVESLRAGSVAKMLGVSVLSALTLAAIHLEHGSDVGFVPETTCLGLLAAGAMLLQVAPLLGRAADPKGARFADHGAGFAAFWMLFHLTALRSSVPLRAVPYFAFALLMLALLGLVATRRGHGGWLLLGVLASGLTHAFAEDRTAASETLPFFVALAIVTAFVAALPLVVGAAARAHVATWRAASLAGPVAFFAATFRYEDRVGEGSRGVVPLVLAAFGLGTVGLARRLLPLGSATRRSAFAWSAVASLSLVSVAIPMQLHDEWVTVSWALQGAAVIALWKRFDHAGIKHYATLLFAMTAVRLVLNPAVLHYHPPSGVPVVNWLAYTYLVPAACFVYAARILGALELPRHREIERRLFSTTFPPIASALGLTAVVVGFVWVNLAVIDAFAEGRHLELLVERRPARDLTMSLAWALYALVLLAIGTWRTIGALRRTSLVLVLLTCAKVFLYDLGNLRDLYRVASLLGLALALIGVSLAYKRFVFRDPPEPS